MGGLVAAAGEGPAADGADVDVDELAAGVIADAAGFEAEGSVAEAAGADAGDADVDGFGLDVLGVLCDAGVWAAGAEKLVTLRSAIAADDVDDALRLAETGHEVVEEVELRGIVGLFVLGAAVAEEVVEPFDGAGEIGVADAVDDVEGFAAVEVVEAELVFFAGVGDVGVVDGEDAGMEERAAGGEAAVQRGAAEAGLTQANVMGPRADVDGWRRSDGGVGGEKEGESEEDGKPGRAWVSRVSRR